MVTYEELSKHNTPTDLWIAINGKVYNITDFLEQHPGTSKPLLYFAGKDGSSGFNSKHPNLDISKVDSVILIGDLET